METINQLKSEIIRLNSSIERKEEIIQCADRMMKSGEAYKESAESLILNLENQIENKSTIGYYIIGFIIGIVIAEIFKH